MTWSIPLPNNPTLLALKLFFQCLHVELPGFSRWAAINKHAHTAFVCNGSIAEPNNQALVSAHIDSQASSFASGANTERPSD